MLLTQSTEREAWTILLRSVGGLICFFALLFTGSRGGLICSALGLLIAGVLMIADRRKRSYWQAIMFGAGGLAVTIGLLSQMTRIVSQGLFDEARSSVYAFCLEAIQQRPWLGSGLGTFGDLMPSFRADDFASWGVWDYAHSTGLEIAVEMGLPVAAMVVMGAFTSLVVLCRAVLGAEGRRRTNLAAITGVAVLSYLHSAIDFSLQIPGYFIPFGILLGCGLAHACPAEAAVGQALLQVPAGAVRKLPHQC
jgi:O-antigen ligase